MGQSRDPPPVSLSLQDHQIPPGIANQRPRPGSPDPDHVTSSIHGQGPVACHLSGAEVEGVYGDVEFPEPSPDRGSADEGSPSPLEEGPVRGEQSSLPAPGSGKLRL
jgi:hypothetical protein